MLSPGVPMATMDDAGHVAPCASAASPQLALNFTTTPGSMVSVLPFFTSL